MTRRCSHGEPIADDGSRCWRCTSPELARRVDQEARPPRPRRRRHDDPPPPEPAQDGEQDQGDDDPPTFWWQKD